MPGMPNGRSTCSTGAWSKKTLERASRRMTWKRAASTSEVRRKGDRRMSGMNAVLSYQSEIDPPHPELGAARRRVAELENELRRLRGESLPHGQSSPFTEM